MSATYEIVIVDLFCGAGGFSTGLVKSIVDTNSDKIAAATGLTRDNLNYRNELVRDWLSEHVILIGVNHWDPAVETFRKNHPWATVLNAKVQAVHPPDAVDGREVNALIAGPSCLPWTRAKGGMAADDQKRMSPRHVAHWLELLRPNQFLLENVPGFCKWGRLQDGEMVKDGALFEHWLGTLRKFGYTVSWKKLVAADYGDPQTRKRLFVMGRLNYDPKFPEPTHSPDGEQPETKPYRTAAEIIDWTDAGDSMWTKSRPLVNATNQRIAAGIRQYGHPALAPFADAIANLTKKDVCDMQADPVPVDDAAEAADERDDPFLVEGPVLLESDDGDYSSEVNTEQDLTTLCVPQVMHGCGGGTCRPVDDPVPTVTAKGGVIHYVDPEAFILPRNGRCRGLDSNQAYDPEEEPVHTVTAKNHDGRKFEACLIPLYSERPNQDPRTRDVTRPLMTVPAKKVPAGISRPFLVKYYGNSDTASVTDPAPTVTATETLALCVPECYPWGLDVRYRMLKPRELARAQGFPDSYEFCADTKRTMTQLIGNAVPVELSRSLCRALLEPTEAPTLNNYVKGPEPPAEKSEADD